MDKEKYKILKIKITEGIKVAIAKVYEDARKSGDELVISENGKVKKIKVT